MKSFSSLILLLLLCPGLIAQDSSPADNSDDSSIVDRPHAQDWFSDIDAGWLMREGDDPAWANQRLEDSGWTEVRLNDLGRSRPGWRWFRRHVRLHENHPPLSLLIQGAAGTYELFINGAPVRGARIRSSFAVNRPVERVFLVDQEGTDLVLALRTHTPAGYSQWLLPQFMSVYLGTEDAVEAERQSMLHERTYDRIPAMVINAFIIFAGLLLFLLYGTQPGHNEYFWLGLYFVLVGVGDLIWYIQQSGFLSLASNVLLADPSIYAMLIAQAHFTFAFGGKRFSRAWRIYQALLIVPVGVTWLVWYGVVPSSAYMIIEPLFILPAAVLLPVLLFVWYRGGNRDAGWIILPSLLPPATMALYDLGAASQFFGWRRLEFLESSISMGPVVLEPNDLGNLLFLMSSLIVIFFRFSRVAHDQARSAVELQAAREIQQQLVPASLPEVPGLRIEAAYLPAQEVGGDFYQVFEQGEGAALIVVGDVSGKGLKAAMTGTLAIGALRTLAGERLRPAELLERLNLQICAAANDGFITCLCAQIDSEGSITLANAGHLSPYSAGIEIEVPSGLPLGLLPESTYAEVRFELARGSTLTLLSDGVVEAANAAGELYGFDRTQAISREPAHSIAAAAQAFGQEDDITVLTLVRTAAVEQPA